ncbi:MAG: hypothetical protein J6Z25_01070, partial [Opitutales bacterium]|nr:hypothetical protein [Opitutales bacterium]
YSFIPLFLYSFIPLFLYSFIPLFLYSFIPLFQKGKFEVKINHQENILVGDIKIRNDFYKIDRNVHFQQKRFLW